MKIIREQLITFVISTIGGCLAIWLMKWEFGVATIATSIIVLLIVFSFIRFGIYRWAIWDAQNTVDKNTLRKGAKVRKRNEDIWDKMEGRFKYRFETLMGGAVSVLFLLGSRDDFDCQHPELIGPMCSHCGHRLVHSSEMPFVNFRCSNCQKKISGEKLLPDFYDEAREALKIEIARLVREYGRKHLSS